MYAACLPDNGNMNMKTHHRPLKSSIYQFDRDFFLDHKHNCPNNLEQGCLSFSYPSTRFMCIITLVIHVRKCIYMPKKGPQIFSHFSLQRPRASELTTESTNKPKRWAIVCVALRRSFWKVVRLLLTHSKETKKTPAAASSSGHGHYSSQGTHAS